MELIVIVINYMSKKS